MLDLNCEQKQRVNLSSLARSVLENDRALFAHGGSQSGFLNRIITMFSETADASIDAALDERRRVLQTALHKRADSAEKDALIDTLLESYREELLAKKESYPQGESVLFRLNNRNTAWLYDDGAEADNYRTPSKYLKALLEEYARLSPAERERVFFGECIGDVIEPAIDAGYALEIRLGVGTFAVRPYAVLADEFSAHLYLVGLSRPLESPDAEERIVSLRVSRIEKIRVRKRARALNADDKRDIEKKLREVGVQYMVGEREEIVLRMTPQAQAAFRERSYMRPNPDKTEADGVYRFFCTARQIKNYFLSFGKEVEVLSPADLREEFRQHYEDGAAMYSEESKTPPPDGEGA